MKVRLCNLGRDLELVISINSSSKVSELKNGVQTKASENNVDFNADKMRLFVSGREMKDDQSISQFINSKDIPVVMAMVRNA